MEETFERLLVCSIQNLCPGEEPLIIEMDGVSERPICHFELPISKFKEKKEKAMSPIDSKYNIIEFESLGTNVKNVKRFMVVNPTSQGYEFEWFQDIDESKAKEKAMFKCLTPKGVVLSGKKYEMVFEYTPDIVGTHESFWVFKIPSEKLQQHFMVVGMVVEPTVLFQVGKVNFGPLLIGGKNREVVNLINQEHIPFPFSFERETIRGSPEYGDSLAVSPLSGTVQPNSIVPVEIHFRPKFERTYNYNLVCNVKRKARPMVLNVKGVGYTIHHEVFLENSPYPILSKEPHNFNYGDFFINEKKTKSVTLKNLGDFNFDYVWRRASNRYITITPESGTAKKGTTVEFILTYAPVIENTLKYKATLSIVSGPNYDFHLTGKARKPGMQLNFNKYDFGGSFVMRQPMPKVAVLEMKNLDNTAISIDCLFEKKAHLDVEISPGQVLLPFKSEGEPKLEVPIIFTPREIEKYSETVTFDFNGIYKMDVQITGEGIPMIIELVRPEDQYIDFGIIGVDNDITKSATLINKSKKPITFRLYTDNEAEFSKNFLSLSPDKELTLRPKEKKVIEINYHPEKRMPAFKHDIMLEIKDNEARRLITITGVSHGIELKLMEDVIGFGNVVQASRLTKQLQMANFGDLPAKFNWDPKQYSQCFTILPESGHIPSHEDLYLEITYHPQLVGQDVRLEKVKCQIQGSDPLFVTLVGACVSQSEKDTMDLNLETIVRTPTKKSINVQNTTDILWRIKPTISTAVDSSMGYFKGNVFFDIPPKSKADYEVTYYPLTMTKESLRDSEDPNSKITHFHEASLFFPLPDGRYFISLF